MNKSINMKKIFYLKKSSGLGHFTKEVKIGDIIDYNGINVIVTDELIKNNPSLFEVEENKYWKCIKSNDTLLFTPATKKEYLLQCTKDKYPKGTRFISILDGVTTHNVNENSIITFGEYVYPYTGVVDIYAIQIDGHIVYLYTQWAEIIKPILRSHDGVDIYQYKVFYVVNKNHYTLYSKSFTHCNNVSSEINKDFEECILFSTIEAAEKWIDDNTVLTSDNVRVGLTDTVYVCHSLLNHIHNIECHFNPIKACNINQYGNKHWMYFSSAEARDKWIEENKQVVKDLAYYEDKLITYKTPLYVELKVKEPKLYYTKILQLIADDLNDKNFDKLNMSVCKYFIRYDSIIDKYDVSNFSFLLDNSICFDSTKKANQATEIMGDKLDFIYKQ